jgi:DNA-directed RNA polymerase specialized sigma24 family protein
MLSEILGRNRCQDIGRRGPDWANAEGYRVATRWQVCAESSARLSASAACASQTHYGERRKSWIFSRFESAAEMLSYSAAMIDTAKNTEEDIRKNAADLYWLAFLLTSRQDLSIEIASDTVVSSDDDESPFFAEWMRRWQRRLVLRRALTAIHDELADSARRTQRARVHGLARVPATASRNWSLSPDTTKADIRQSLLAIDPFPRAALLLLVFEGILMADAAILLDADPALIRKAQAIGVRELTANLAGKNSPEDQRGSKLVTEAPKKLCSWLRTTALCH